MPTTIDQTSLEEHDRYARQTQDIEAFAQEYGIDSVRDTGFIPKHTNILAEVPELRATEALFGTRQKASWAYFPIKSAGRIFHFKIFYNIELDKDNKIKVEQVDCTAGSKRSEESLLSDQAKVKNLIEERITLREYYEYAIGRIGQFVQG